MDGVEVTSSMGLNSWAGFAGTDDKAHVAGDIVMTAKEVNPVIQASRKGGIEVMAVHNHMMEEQPRDFLWNEETGLPVDSYTEEALNRQMYSGMFTGFIP